MDALQLQNTQTAADNSDTCKHLRIAFRRGPATLLRTVQSVVDTAEK